VNFLRKEEKTQYERERCREVQVKQKGLWYETEVKKVGK